jgi:hypothetical protein
MKVQRKFFWRFLVSLLTVTSFLAVPSMSFIGCRYVGTTCPDTFQCGDCYGQAYTWVCPDGTIMYTPTGKCCTCA